MKPESVDDTPSWKHAWREGDGALLAQVEGLPVLMWAGRFELLGMVGRGGLGEVWLGRDSRSAPPQLAAVKRLRPQHADDPEMVDMFRDEARLCRQLEHPNLCRVIESWLEGNTAYLALEWIHGLSLRELMRPRFGGPLVPPAIAVRTILDAARGLHYLHTLADEDRRPLGAVHRDISPHNLMVGFDGRTRVIDLGIAKWSRRLRQTRAGVVKGKYAYLAPEQVMGHSVDARTDVYALGMCLYAALTGRQPFAELSHPMATMVAVVSEPLPRPRALLPEIPESLEALVLGATAKNAAERPANAAAFADALAAWLLDQGRDTSRGPVAAYLDRVVPRARRDLRRMVRTASGVRPKVERALQGAAEFLPVYIDSQPSDVDAPDTLVSSPPAGLVPENDDGGDCSAFEEQTRIDETVDGSTGLVRVTLALCAAVAVVAALLALC